MSSKENKYVEDFECKEHGFFWTLIDNVSYFEFKFFVQKEKIVTKDNKEEFYQEINEKIREVINKYQS